ncbi:MAG: hypothetical protein LBS09_04800 [Bacteroidales bacterium]|jgi:hypothetical protein|nr:hypothetical protein [Bacteroidales bacterium]
MNRWLVSACIALGMTASAQAQSIQANARLDTAVMLIGDQIKLHVEVEKRNDVRVQFPVWDNALSAHIEIIGVTPVDSVAVSADVTRFTQDVVITAFDSGRQELPEIRFPFTDNGYHDTIATTPLYVDVLVMPTDTLKQIADIKPIYQLPVGWADIYPWLLLAGVILLLAAIIVFLIYALGKRRKHQPVFGPPKLVDPPHVIALRELDRLRNEKLWQNNRTKEYYTRLSDIVRMYIERRFGVAAMEMTGKEILYGLKAANFEDNNLMNRLQQLFSLSDLAKFAKSEPLPDENETSMLDSYLFVNNTKKEMVETQEKTGEKGNATVESAEHQKSKTEHQK